MDVVDDSEYGDEEPDDNVLLDAVESFGEVDEEIVSDGEVSWVLYGKVVLMTSDVVDEVELTVNELVEGFVFVDAGSLVDCLVNAVGVRGEEGTVNLEVCPSVEKSVTLCVILPEVGTVEAEACVVMVLVEYCVVGVVVIGTFEVNVSVEDDAE